MNTTLKKVVKAASKPAKSLVTIVLYICGSLIGKTLIKLPYRKVE